MGAPRVRVIAVCYSIQSILRVRPPSQIFQPVVPGGIVIDMSSDGTAWPGGPINASRTIACTYGVFPRGGTLTLG